MELALDVLDRALKGDDGARSFLERTSSSYVLDMTVVSKPKTYGCWNFIHQAMNECERYESKFAQNSFTNGSANGSELNAHIRLLATMALRVARRSPETDKNLIATSIANASQYNGTSSQSQWLIDLNLELREIVMGRIAAMAFDFNFHRCSGPQVHSAFADRVVMDTFCAILSANAVSSGPQAIRHFATEWIIPSSRNLPFLAVASVVFHLASEGMRKSAPMGTKDMLQQLSPLVMSVVLVPALSDAVADNGSTGSSHVENSQVVAISVRAMKTWCLATDMSLPQIRHICNKVNVNVVGVISDAMYSDSHQVVDALADLIDTTVLKAKENDPIPEGRMNQVRHIIQVDESSFQSQFTLEQLQTIEAKEMKSILDDLISAIGLQRFRFAERKRNGDHDVCRNLTRIAASVCGTLLDFSCDETTSLQSDDGAISLLVLAASHPSVNICGIALQALTRIMPTVPSISKDLLPVLQRRAITPHHYNSGVVSLVASDLCGVHFHEFQNFRESVLGDCLVVCWRQINGHYMDSCTSAVEEFCSDQSSAEVSLQLEAALFCIEVIAGEALNSDTAFPYSEQIKRCINALSRKPQSLTTNPLTLGRMCRFVRKYSPWFCEADGIGPVTALVSSVFVKAASANPGEGFIREILKESQISPLSDASLALREILCRSPEYFVDENSLTSLRVVWEASYELCADTIRIEDRIALSVGLCRVLASLPGAQRIRSFDEVVAPSLDLLNQNVSLLQKAQDSSPLAPILSRIAVEIRLLSTMARTFVNIGYAEDMDITQSGHGRSLDRRAPIPEAVLIIVRKGWPAIDHVARHHCNDENISSAIGTFLCNLLPPSSNGENNLALLKDLTSTASSILKTANGGLVYYDAIFAFLEEFIRIYGEGVENAALATLAGSSPSADELEVGKMVEELLLELLGAVRDSLGSKWNEPKEQGQGQEAFESKPHFAPKADQMSQDSLARVFSLVATCMVTCPVFLFYLPAEAGLDRDDDKLLRRAIDTAVTSLNDNDQEITLKAIKFLMATGEQARTQNDDLRAFLLESSLRVRAEAVKRLLVGCCGSYSFSVTSEAAELIAALMQSSPSSADLEAVIASALRQDCFLLGEQSRRVAIVVLSRCAQNQLNASDVRLFMEDLWRLYQVDDKDALPYSDVVAGFVRKYGS